MKRKLTAVFLILLVALAGVRLFRAKLVRHIVQARAGITADYVCDGGAAIHAVFYSGADPRAEIALSDGRKLTLRQTVAASGVRYANADESIVFWTKGDTAFLEENGKMTYTNGKLRQQQQ